MYEALILVVLYSCTTDNFLSSHLSIMMQHPVGTLRENVRM